MPAKKIAIIGGGILGLSTAYYLLKDAKDAIEITIFEKSDKLGGLAITNRIEGMEIEKFYHHFFKSDTSLYDLLKDLGLEDKLRWYKSKMGIYHEDKLIDFSSALDILKFPNLNFFQRLKLGIGSFYLQKWPSNKPFENISAIDWCNKFFGAKIASIFWEPLLKSKFAEDYRIINMIWLRARLKDRASSRGLPWKDEKLGYIDGSINTLFMALMKVLKEKKVRIQTSTQIKSYQFKVNSHRLVYLDGEKGNKEITEDFDILVSTVSPKVFVKLFSPPKKYINELQKIKFLSAMCLTIVSKTSFMPYYWLTINDPKKPFLAVIEHTNFLDKALYGNKSILYMGKYLTAKDLMYFMPQEEIEQLAKKLLKEINPKFDLNSIEKIYLAKADTAQHVIDPTSKPLLPYTGKKGLYYSHFSQIFEHDRGVNYAIAQGNNLSKLIIKNERINSNS